MMARADEFGNIHSGLSSLNADGWEGRAADHFRSKFKVQVQGWVDAQEAFSSASEAYSSYASTLASAQSQCDGIRVRWEQGRDAVQQAQNNQADARSEAAAYGVLPVFGASCNEGPGRSAMAAAEADFQTLVDQVNEAGDLLITALNAGITKLPERTWWDAVTRTAGSILGGAFEAVVEIVKLVWKLSGGEGMWDFGRVLMGDMTLEEYDIKHREIPTDVGGHGEGAVERSRGLYEGCRQVADRLGYVDRRSRARHRSPPARRGPRDCDDGWQRRRVRRREGPDRRSSCSSHR